MDKMVIQKKIDKNSNPASMCFWGHIPLKRDSVTPNNFFAHKSQSFDVLGRSCIH